MQQCAQYLNEQIMVHVWKYSSITIDPYDYCTLSNSTDEHCAFHHTGIDCGKCQDQSSLILGSSLCLPCSSLYPLLLIMFVLAGLSQFGCLMQMCSFSKESVDYSLHTNQNISLAKETPYKVINQCFLPKDNSPFIKVSLSRNV